MAWRIESRQEMLGAETATQLLERASLLVPDTSKIVYQFPDGWSIRMPDTWADMDREGILMGNCLAAEENRDTPDPDHPWNWYFDENIDFDKKMDRYLNESHRMGMFYSLRDPNNIPRAIYDGFPNSLIQVGEILGRHNSIPKIEYAQRFVDAGIVPKSLMEQEYGTMINDFGNVGPLNEQHPEYDQELEGFPNY